MTDLYVNPEQSNILTTALLESLFSAEISYTERGTFPRTSDGIQLEEFQFRSTWITYNKLVKDIHEIVGSRVWPIVDPSRGCRICIRGVVTEVVGDKNLTSFVFAIDPLGYETNAVLKHRLPVFSEHEIFESLAEFHGIPVKRSAPEKELLVSEFTVRWYGLTEFLTQCRLFVDGTLAGKQGTLYLISHETKCHDQPARNETRFKIAHELSY